MPVLSQLTDWSSDLRRLAERSTLLNTFACYNMPYYKLLMVLQLSALAVAGSIGSYWNLIPVAAAMLTAVIVDTIYNYYMYENFAFPAGSLITALIVAGIVFPGDLVSAVSITALALVLKHGTKFLEVAVSRLADLFDYSYTPSFRNVFNPAALGLLAGGLFLGTSLTWWMSGSSWVFLLGLPIAFLIKVDDLALSFLVPWFLLNAALNPAYFTTGGTIDVLGALTGQAIFFAFIMVVEPVTSPNTRRSRILFGVGVAVLAFALQAASSYIPLSVTWLLIDSFIIALLAMNLVHRVLPGGWMR